MKTNRIKLVAALLCGLFSSAASAEKWYWEPVFSVRTGYDDNIRLVTSNEESAFNTHLAADARFGFRTEVSDVKFQTALRTHQYAGLDDLDYNEALFGVDASLRRNLDTFELDASVLRDSSRTSELSTSGSVRTSIPRVKVYIGPSWSRQLTEKTQLQLGYAYSDVSYDNKSGTSLTDYRYDTANIGLVHKLSENTDLQTTLLGSYYEADDIYSKSENFGFQVGLSRRFTETLSASVALGLTHTTSFFENSAGQRDEESDVTPLVSISFNKDWERSSLNGSISTSESPSGEGRMLRRNSVKLNLKRKLTERVNFSLNNVYYSNETAGGRTISGDERTYFSIEPKLSWRASRWWTITGSYRYRSQEYTESSDGVADSNAVYLNVRYVWPRPSYSRWMEL